MFTKYSTNTNTNNTSTTANQKDTITCRIRYNLQAQKMDVSDSQFNKELDEHLPIPSFYHIYAQEMDQVLQQAKNQNQLPYQDKTQWTSQKIDQLYTDDPETFKRLELCDITHFRRYNTGLGFEFLCVWKNHFNQTMQTWQRFFIIRNHPKFIDYVPSHVWNPETILNDFYEYKLHYELREPGQDNEFDKISSSLNEQCIYRVKTIPKTPSS